jgi:phage FluMu protein Com
MKEEMVRCKACGYVMAKASLSDVCPACGVKKEMFEPWEDKVGHARRFWLELHVHPIIVHLPNSFAPILLILAAVYPFVPAAYQVPFLWPVVQLLSWIFPVVVLGGFLSGLVDGKVRYRKVTTPLLFRKILFGSLFIVASVVMAVLVSVANFGPGSTAVYAGYLVASLVSMAAASVLGKWGASLFNAAMPGDKVFLGKKKKPAAKAAPAQPAAPKTEDKKE